MKKYLCLFIILLLHVSNINATDNMSITEILKEQLAPIISEAHQKYSMIAGQTTCYSIIHNSFIIENETKKNFFFEKLIQDSSKNKNDLTTYYNCKKRKYEYNETNLSNITYIEVIVDQTNRKMHSLESEALFYIFGMCVPSGCSQQDYEILLSFALRDLFRYNSTDNITSINCSVILLDEMNPKNYDLKELLLSLIPLFLLIIQVVLVVFKVVPFCIFKICFKKKRQHSLLENKSFAEISEEKTTLYSKNEFKVFLTNMSLKKHWEKLFNVKDSGITYIKGLRGINIIFLFFGYLYFCLYNNPISIYEEKSFLRILTNLFYFVFFIGLRYAPPILISCSGYSMFYKFTCFLDEKVQDVGVSRQEDKEKRKKKQKEPMPIQNILNNNNIIESEDDDEEEEEEDKKKKNDSLKGELGQTMVKFRSKDEDVRCKFYVLFVLNQAHKYIMYVFAIIFIRFSLHYIVLLINNFEIGPIWGYCWKKIINFGMKDLVKSIFLGYAIGSFNNPMEQREMILHYMSSVMMEIFYFIIIPFFLFLAYRFKFRFDIGIVCAFVIAILGKILAFFIFNAYNSQDHEERFVTFYYSLDGHPILRYPLVNCTYPLIGFFFGGINYIFQKKYREWNNILQSKKTWLSSQFSCYKFFERKSKNLNLILGIVFLLIVIIFSNYHLLIFRLYPKDKFDEHLGELLSNHFLNFFMLIDSEIVVVLIHLMAFSFFYVGDNIFSNFLTSSMWNLFEKLYFSIILLINPVIIYVLAQCESRIHLTAYNLIIYTLICGFIVILVAGFAFVFVESPMQNIVKLITSTFLKEPQQEEIRDPALVKLGGID